MKKAMLVFALIMGVALVAGPVLAQTPPTTTVLKGNPMGGVNFDHAKHGKLVGDEVRHLPSRVKAREGDEGEEPRSARPATRRPSRRR